MFFSFCSDDEYPEELWPAVWALQVAIQALLLDMHEAPIQKVESTDDLVNLLKCRIREYGFSTAIMREGISLEWIDAFLDQQAANLFSFVERTRTLSAAATFRALKPDKQRLMDCAARSDLFRVRIAERASRGREYLSGNEETET